MSHHAIVDAASFLNRGAPLLQHTNNWGFYYGLRDDVMHSPSQSVLADNMSQTLYELRQMREEMSCLKREMRSMLVDDTDNEEHQDNKAGDHTHSNNHDSI
eukprot:scaffold136646_cov55-Attheya_sp.AAC.3